MDVLEKLGAIRLFPVITIDDAKGAAPLAQALLAGGLPCAEVTFRTDAAEASVRAFAARGDMLVGAGTILSIEQAKQASGAGAKFLISPGFNPKVVQYCVDNKIAIFPGCATPTDVEQALGFGLTVVKFFPAEAYGGIRTLKALAAPYRMMRFVPTGGIETKNLRDYLEFPPVVAVGGSWMVKPEILRAGRFDEVTRLTREAVEMVKSTSKNR